MSIYTLDTGRAATAAEQIRQACCGLRVRMATADGWIAENESLYDFLSDNDFYLAELRQMLDAFREQRPWLAPIWGTPNHIEITLIVTLERSESSKV